jgi:Ca-activated chloride channel family protein
MRFADPWWLLLVPLALLLVWRRRRRPPTVLYSSVDELRGLPRTMAQRLRGLMPVVEVLGLCLVAVAIARPQSGREDSVVASYGVAIELVIDKSQSMAETDLDPDPWDREELTRLDVVKRVVADFVDPDGDLPGRPNDLLGLCSFAGYVDAHCPLTLDHQALLQLLAGIEMPRVDGRDPAAREQLMTAIGDALVLAVDRLGEAPAESKVVVLLSDGESNIGEASTRAAAEAAKAAGVKVYTVGVGRQGQGLDEDALVEIAEITGGQYFNARDAASLERVYRGIDELERSEIHALQFTRWRERFVPPLLAGIGLLLVHRLLLDTRLRGLP